MPYDDIPAGAKVVSTPTAPTFDDIPKGARVVTAPNMPDLREADLARDGSFGAQLAHGFNQPLKDLADAVAGVGSDLVHNTPIEQSKTLGMVGSLLGTDFGRAMKQAALEGHFSEAARNALLANPVGAAIAHGYEGIGEQIGMTPGANLANWWYKAPMAMGNTLANASAAAISAGDMPEGAGTFMQDWSRNRLRGTLKPREWFNKMPMEKQNAALDLNLQKGVGRNVGKAENIVDDLMNQTDQKLAGQGGERLPFDRLDQLIEDTPQSTSWRFNPGERPDMSAKLNELRQIKFENATPQEIADARQAIANGYTVRAQLEAKPGDPPVEPVKPETISDAEVKANAYPSSMTVDDYMNLKRQWRSASRNPTTNARIMTTTARLTEDAAETANRIMIDQYPELQQLGADTRDAINLRNVVRQAAARSVNAALGGTAGALSPAIAAVSGAATAGKAWVLGAIWKSPEVRSAIASAVYKASGNTTPLSQTLGRAAYMASQADAAHAAEEKQAASKNAGQ